MTTTVPRRGGDEEPFVPLAAVIAHLDVKESTFRRWRKYGKGPTGYRFGKHVKFRLSEVEEWAQQHRDRAS